MPFDYTINLQNKFQLGNLPPNKIPVEVWLQVQPGEPKHNSMIMAICEERRIETEMREKDKNLKRFQRTVKRRLAKEARKKAERKAAESHCTLSIQSRLSLRRFASQAGIRALPENCTPHSADKLTNQVPFRRGLAEDKSSPDQEERPNQYLRSKDSIKKLQPIPSIRRKHNALPTNNSPVNFCKNLHPDQVLWLKDENLDHACDELQYLRNHARHRMVSKALYQPPQYTTCYKQHFAQL